MQSPLIRFAAALACAPLLMLAGVGTLGASASGQTTYYVSVSGNDVNPCTQTQPCATMQHAVDIAPAGSIVKVWPGSYNQTVNITKPITLEGSGVSQTNIDGTNVDTAAGQGTGSSTPYYGVVSVQNNSGAGGPILIKDMTIRNAYVTAQESAEIIVPSDISIYDDFNAGDAITVTNVTLRAVQNWRTYGGIGFDTFNDAASVSFTNSVSRGNFQGALLEGGGFGGAVTVYGDTFKNLVPCASLCSGSSTVYPAEGLFVLSDEPGTAVAKVQNSSFYGYAGLGIAAAAGYSGGNCSSPNGPCPGNAHVSFLHNQFKLQACASASDACDAIIYDAEAGNELTASIKNNYGSVVKPDQGVVKQPDSGVYNVTLSNNHIKKIA